MSRSTNVINGILQREIKDLAIAASSSGQNALIAAVPGYRIVVLAYTIVAAGAVTAQFESATTDLTGAMSLAENGGASTPFNPYGHFATGVNEALNLTLGGAVAVAGHLNYYLEPA